LAAREYFKKNIVNNGAFKPLSQNAYNLVSLVLILFSIFPFLASHIKNFQAMPNGSPFRIAQKRLFSDWSERIGLKKQSPKIPSNELDDALSSTESASSSASTASLPCHVKTCERPFAPPADCARPEGDDKTGPKCGPSIQLPARDNNGHDVDEKVEEGKEKEKPQESAENDDSDKLVTPDDNNACTDGQREHRSSSSFVPASVIGKKESISISSSSSSACSGSATTIPGDKSGNDDGGFDDQREGRRNRLDEMTSRSLRARRRCRSMPASLTSPHNTNQNRKDVYDENDGDKLCIEKQRSITICRERLLKKNTKKKHTLDPVDMSAHTEWDLKFRTAVGLMRQGAHIIPVDSLTHLTNLKRLNLGAPNFVLQSDVCRASTKVTPDVSADWVWPIALLPGDLSQKLRTDKRSIFKKRSKKRSSHAPPKGPEENEEFRSCLRSARVALYLHGGGYVLCSKSTHRTIAYGLAKKADCIVFIPNYRLIPEATFDAVVDDALASYRFLLDAGVLPDNIVITGDSAGGGLAVLLCRRVMELGMPLPTALMLSSPWVDLDYTTQDQSLAHPMSRFDMFQTNTAVYRRVCELVAGERKLNDPLISPLYADLRGLPSIYIQLGEFESFRPQIEKFFEKLRYANVECMLEIVPLVPHVPVLWANLHTEAQAAETRIAEFLKDPQNYLALHRAQVLKTGLSERLNKDYSDEMRSKPRKRWVSERLNRDYSDEAPSKPRRSALNGCLKKDTSDQVPSKTRRSALSGCLKKDSSDNVDI